MLIIGVGNADRGDDGAGLAVVKLLQERLDHRDEIRVIQHWGESTGLVDAMTGWDEVLIIDAASSGSAPGSYRTFDVGEAGLPSDLAALSSHGFGIPQAIELARALDTLPKRCRIYAIEGATFEAGAPLSDVMHLAIEAVTQEILTSLEAVYA
jgi:hydrogenase maturation protease